MSNTAFRKQAGRTSGMCDCCNNTVDGMAVLRGEIFEGRVAATNKVVYVCTARRNADVVAYDAAKKSAPRRKPQARQIVASDYNMVCAFLGTGRKASS